jgi:protein-tyrosine-phosphatase
VSRGLSRVQIAEADEIYGMTRAHVQGVLGIDPGAAGKVHLLDPGGEEVPDPIGLSRDAYYSTAERLRGMIAQRLKEWRT